MTLKERVKDMYTRVDGSGEGDNGFRYQPATQHEVDLAAGVTELRQQLAATEKTLHGYRSLSDAQQEVINDWREKLATITEQRDSFRTAAEWWAISHLNSEPGGSWCDACKWKWEGKILEGGHAPNCPVARVLSAIAACEPKVTP